MGEELEDSPTPRPQMRGNTLVVKDEAGPPGMQPPLRLLVHPTQFPSTCLCQSLCYVLCSWAWPKLNLCLQKLIIGERIDNKIRSDALVQEWKICMKCSWNREGLGMGDEGKFCKKKSFGENLLWMQVSAAAAFSFPPPLSTSSSLSPPPSRLLSNIVRNLILKNFVK